jgi:predicted esterase
VDKAVEILKAQERVKLVFLGFSQGVAMAYRAAMSGAHRADGVIALGGDIPPELKVRSSGEGARPWPPVLIGSGWHDKFYGTDKVHADVSFLGARGIAHEVVRFHGGHEWSEEFRKAAAVFLEKL